MLVNWKQWACYEYNPENAILLIVLWLHSVVSLSDGEDIWPAAITFLLKANLLVILRLLTLWKIWEFVKMGPHTITYYLNNKKYMNTTTGELLCKTSTDTPSAVCGQTLIEVAIVI